MNTTTNRLSTFALALAMTGLALANGHASPPESGNLPEAEDRDTREEEGGPKWDTHRYLKYTVVPQKLDADRYLKAVKIGVDYWGDLWPDNTYVVTGDLDGNGEGGDAVTITDNDADQDQTPDAEERDALRAWRNALWLFLKLIGAVADLGMNGVYDGYVRDAQGNTAAAVLDLVAKNGDLTGTLYIVDRGVALDTGWWPCPTVDVPVTTFPVSATLNSAGDHADGSFQRSLSIGPWTGTIYGDYDVEQLDFDHVAVDMTLDVPSPCGDQNIDGVFTRRPGEF